MNTVSRTATEIDVNHDPRSAARRLRCAEQTLANWRHLRRGPAYIRLGRKIIYRESDLVAYENRNRIDPETS
jgi:hypothetical protein